MAREFEVRGHQYAYGKMDAMTQFHVICKFGPAMKVAAERGGTTLLETFAALSDQDREFVVSRCLSAVKRRSGDGWADIWNRHANGPNFEDMTAIEFMDIASQVMEESFRDFFPEPLSDSAEGDQAGP
jgi:hypothetical protein